MRFYVGTHVLASAWRFERVMLSWNRLRTRRKDLHVREWLLDSGAFTELARHGRHRSTVDEYATAIRRWARCGTLVAAVAQDFMCEPAILARTGLSIREHQALTLGRYDDLVACAPGVPILPVLQGYAPSDYARHVIEYGARLVPGAWVGVGSVCKRNASPGAIEAVLLAIHAERPDLRLHGFGIKRTALGSGLVRASLYSADSMAWSYAARRNGRDRNAWQEAERFRLAVETMPISTCSLWAGITKGIAS